MGLKELRENLMATEEVNRQMTGLTSGLQELPRALVMLAPLFSTNDPWRSTTMPSATTGPLPSTMLMKRPIRMGRVSWYRINYMMRRSIGMKRL